MSDTTAVTFTIAELWLLRAVVRHELPAMGQWLYPPANQLLNDAIAEAILLCTDHNQTEAALQLSYGDCFCLDYCVPQDAKDPDGRPIGRTVLLKSFRARAELRRGYPVAEVDGMDAEKSAVAAKLRAAGLGSEARATPEPGETS